MSGPMTPTEWLLAAIEERERQIATWGQLGTDHTYSRHISAYLAALREIVEMHSERVATEISREGARVVNGCEECGLERTWPCPTLRAVAAIFKDRDGYEEWFGDE